MVFGYPICNKVCVSDALDVWKKYIKNIARVFLKYCKHMCTHINHEISLRSMWQHKRNVFRSISQGHRLHHSQSILWDISFIEKGEQEGIKYVINAINIPSKHISSRTRHLVLASAPWASNTRMHSRCELMAATLRGAKPSYRNYYKLSDSVKYYGIVILK